MKLEWKIFGWILFIWALCTSGASASVRINEIAWMGTAASSTGEWIELANDGGTQVSLSGWHLEATEGSPKIALSGVIGANGYLLIERTSDSTIPNVPADIVVSFGTGLSNAGETLVLKDATGMIVDTVVGGTNWKNIGGNNLTKQTAQRLEGSLGGWITGMPTPRAANVRPTAVVTTASTPQSIKTTPSKVGTKETTKPFEENATGTILWKHGEVGPGRAGFLSGRYTEWFFVFVGIVLSIFAAFIIVHSGRKEETPTADDYRIVEDIIESADD